MCGIMVNVDNIEKTLETAEMNERIIVPDESNLINGVFEARNAGSRKKMTLAKWKEIGRICGYDGTKEATTSSKDADRLRKACSYEMWKKLVHAIDLSGLDLSKLDEATRDMIQNPNLKELDGALDFHFDKHSVKAEVDQNGEYTISFTVSNDLGQKKKISKGIDLYGWFGYEPGGDIWIEKIKDVKAWDGPNDGLNRNYNKEIVFLLEFNDGSLGDFVIEFDPETGEIY